MNLPSPPLFVISDRSQARRPLIEIAGAAFRGGCRWFSLREKDLPAAERRATLDRDLVPRNTWNGEILLKSWAEIRRIEATGATVICGHDDAQWASLRKGADAYD